MPGHQVLHASENVVQLNLYIFQTMMSFVAKILLRYYSFFCRLSTLWMDGLLFYVLFNSISEQWLDYSERLCAMKPPLRFENLPP